MGGARDKGPQREGEGACGEWLRTRMSADDFSEHPGRSAWSAKWCNRNAPELRSAYGWRLMLISELGLQPST